MPSISQKGQRMPASPIRKLVPFAEAAKKASAAAPWRGREGMTPDYSRHLAEITILDALERAATFARGRTE